MGGFTPIRDAVFFESIFDRLAPLRFISASQFAGALGFVVAAKQ
jgi:hypothetical protein